MLCLRHHCRKYTLCSAAFKLHRYKMIHAFTLFITFLMKKAYTATMLTFSQTIFSPQTTSQHKLLYLEAKRNQHFSPLINPRGHTNNNNNSIDSGSGCWEKKPWGLQRSSRDNEMGAFNFIQIRLENDKIIRKQRENGESHEQKVIVVRMTKLKNVCIYHVLFGKCALCILPFLYILHTVLASKVIISK